MLYSICANMSMQAGAQALDNRNLTATMHSIDNEDVGLAMCQATPIFKLLYGPSRGAIRS